MLLLLTGASGVGKWTARELIAAGLAPEVRCVELTQVVEMPVAPDLAWRQRATEEVVKLALAKRERGVDLLLDCGAEEQRRRLERRGDLPGLLDAHEGFTAWMREHAADPRRRLEVLTSGGAEGMRWERLEDPEVRAAHWPVATLDTTSLHPQQVAAEVLAWCRATRA